MPTSLFVFCETVPCNRLLVNLSMVTFMLSRLTLKKMYVSWFYNINSICLTSKLSLNMWVWVFGCVLLCFCIPISITSYTHTHTLAGLCRAGPSSWPLAVSPWEAIQLPNLSPPPRSQSPGSAPTPYSTNCLSISPVPANYQLLMNGSPYCVEMVRGEERAGFRASWGGEESIADWC